MILYKIHILLSSILVERFKSILKIKYSLLTRWSLIEMTILFLIRGNWFQQILTKKTVYLSILKFFGWLCLVFFFVFHLNFIDLKLQISCRHYKYALMMWKSAFNKLTDNNEKYFKILGIWTCWWNFMKFISDF